MQTARFQVTSTWTYSSLTELAHSSTLRCSHTNPCRPSHMLTHTHGGTDPACGMCDGGHLHLDQVRNFSDPRPHLGATALLAPKGENGGLRQTLARPHCWLKCDSRGVGVMGPRSLFLLPPQSVLSSDFKGPRVDLVYPFPQPGPQQAWLRSCSYANINVRAHAVHSQQVHTLLSLKFPAKAAKINWRRVIV